MTDVHRVPQRLDVVNSCQLLRQFMSASNVADSPDAFARLSATRS
jgi:hypothetical protein